MDSISSVGLCRSNKSESTYSGYLGSQRYRFMPDVKGVEKVSKHSQFASAKMIINNLEMC